MALATRASGKIISNKAEVSLCIKMAATMKDNGSTAKPMVSANTYRWVVIHTRAIG
jgi:hypothetical protein